MDDGPAQLSERARLAGALWLLRGDLAAHAEEVWIVREELEEVADSGSV